MNARKRPARRGVRILVAGEPMPFEEIFALDDPRAAEQAFELAQTFEPAVTADGRLDLAEAQRIVDDDPDLYPAGTLDVTLAQDHDQVAVMVDQVTQTLSDFLDVALPQVQVDQIAAAVTYAFTNLDTQGTDAWIFYRSESGHSTTYQYNIMFAVQNEATGDAIFGVPLGLTIAVNREYERVLFITLKDEVSYAVRIEGLRVLVPFKAAIAEGRRLSLRALPGTTQAAAR